MSEADKAALAVAQVLQVVDMEWSDRLVELLRDADMDSFRTKLLAEHKRRMDALSDRRELYRSPNGDTWFLGREPANGYAFVIHQPNAPSGGRLSHTDLGAFSGAAVLGFGGASGVRPAPAGRGRSSSAPWGSRPVSSANR